MTKNFCPSDLDGQLLKQILAQNILSAFINYTYQGYMMSWCHEDICRRLDHFIEKVKAKQSPRMIICMPPRSGKTEIASRRFPAYVFGKYPDINIIATSYSGELAYKNCRDVQRIIDSESFAQLFPNVKLPENNKGFVRRADTFEIVKYGGTYRSAGVGGSITGMGGDIMIVDDPFKDRSEADSATIRNKIWDWYTSTFYTRLSSGGGIIVIATRWHMDDLTGRLIEAMKREDGDQWDIVEYPAIATHDEKFRKAGEALHPERYPLSQLLSIKAAIGTRDWESLYQQKPLPDGGAIFKKEWLKLYNPSDMPEHFDEIISSWDMTFKDGTTNDYVAGQVWGRKGAQYFLLDQVHRQMDFVNTLDEFIRLSEKYPNCTKKFVEDTANGPAVINMLNKKIHGIIPVKADGSKTSHAYAVTPLFEAGNVYIPNPQWCDWARDYIDEMLQFPSGAHDDQVDATTQALRQFVARRGVMRINPNAIKRSPFRR